MRVAPLGPIAGAYYLDNSRVAIIEGPVGSGKSTGSCLRLQRHTYEQIPSPRGVAQTRWAIVRNTKKQLEDTTMKTWFQIFPENEYGIFKSSSMTHHWEFTPQGFAHPIQSEFIFRALDDEADVADLLSLEVTGFWFNELREIVQEILAHAGRRTRYLNGERPSTWSGWIGDTNPWDSDHFLEEKTNPAPPAGWAHFRQPGGLDPEAENLENLEQTAETLSLPFDDPRRRDQGRTYYTNAIADYTKEDADIYVHAKRGRSRAGKPIYTDYNERIHRQHFQLIPRLPLRIGFDFGRTPAALIAQRTATWQWRIRFELCAEDMGVKKFGEMLKRFLAENCPGLTIAQCTGDPAGNAKDGDDRTAFDHLKASDIICLPAITNELSTRIEAVNGAMRRLEQGEPGLIIHPDCKRLTRACLDGYHYRKLKVAGNRYADEPEKNEWSHPAEALQYLLLGGGEKTKVLATPTYSRPIVTKTTWSPHDRR